MPKQLVRRIDLEPAQSIGGGDIISSAESIAPPIPAALSGPRNLVATAGPIVRSAATPQAYIDVAWEAPINALEPQSYLIERDTTSAFTNPQRDYAYQIGTRLAVPTGLQSGILYYFRVAAVYANGQQSDWSNIASATTVTDTTPPSAPSNQALTFIGAGDAVITHTPSNSENYRDTEILIYNDTSKTVQYAIISDATGRIVWTAAQNRAATAGAGDASLYIELRSRSWSNVYSSAVNTGLVTKAAPTAPTVTSDFSGVDCVYTITPPSDAATVRFVADTSVTARDIGVVGRYAYVFDQNRLDHSGTPDPVLSYNFTAVDGLGQASTAATGTATNAAPSAPSVTLEGGVGVVVARVTSTQPNDLDVYEYVWKRNTVTILTLESKAAEQTLNIINSGSYTVTVRTKDVFAQYSSAITPSAVQADFGLDLLRATLEYSDDISSTTSALSALKDTVITSGGIAYTASTWHWILGKRPLIDRIKPITVAATAGLFYVGLSTDGATYTWYSGPLAADGVTFASVASESAAQTAAVGIPAGNRFFLPSEVEARYIKLGHRHTAGYTVREFYPRRVTVADDVYTETLSALSSNIGTITAGQIYGTTIASRASGARWEGNSTKLFGTDGTTTQWEVLNTNGQFTWAGGNGVLGASGASVLHASSISPLPQNGFSLRDSSGNTVGGVFGGKFVSVGTTLATILNCTPPSGQDAIININANATSASSQIQLNTDSASLYIDTTINTGSVFNTTANINAGAGVNVGSATGAISGEVRASSGIGSTKSSGSAIFALDSTNVGSTLTIPASTTATQFGNANNFSGLFLVNNTATGDLGLFLTGQGQTIMITQTGTIFSTAGSTSGKICVVLAGLVCSIQNNTASSVTLTITAIRVRNAN